MTLLRWLLVALVLAFASWLGYAGLSHRAASTVSTEEHGSFLKVADAPFGLNDLTAQIARGKGKKGGNTGGTTTTTSTPPVATTTTSTPPSPVSFTDTMGVTGILQETGSMLESASRDWWLNSGGYFTVSGGTGRTVLGSLPERDPWRLEYARTNPTDTDDGYHPQNIFRFVQRGTWKNFTQEAFFKVDADQASASPNRNASNGLLLFNRYQSGDDVYYAGLRVDGYAVIKKKYRGTYYTLAYVKALPGTYSTGGNLIPKGQWIGIRTAVADNADGSVAIRFYLDIGRTGTWALAAQATDVPGKNGPDVIRDGGYAGIRTDFMDVEIDDYRITSS